MLCSQSQMFQTCRHFISLSQVHKSNKSQLAQLVRDSYYGKMVQPRLADTAPIRLLAEIAVEKILRDYMNAFIGTFYAYQLSNRVKLIESMNHVLTI